MVPFTVSAISTVPAAGAGWAGLVCAWVPATATAAVSASVTAIARIFIRPPPVPERNLRTARWAGAARIAPPG